MLRTRLVGVVILALAVAGCGSSDKPSPDATGAPGEVIELARLETLKRTFAEDEGKARLLILLSPT